MSNLKVNIEVIDNKVERDSLVDRVEVLERVKSLLLLPELEMATSQQVADFYDVDLQSIKSVVGRNRNELESDGYMTLSGREIRERLDGCILKPSKIEPKLGHFIINHKGKQTKITYRNVALFPKRAILRVGMLLRDSEVAKEVRTQLLNIEEHATTEIKTYDIDYEQQLHLKLGQAVANGDMLKAIEITKEVEAYKNRHIIEKADKYDKFLDQEGLIAFDTIAKQFFGTTAIKLRQELQERGILGRKKIDGAWSPNSGYEKYFVKSPYHTGWSTTWHTKVNHAGLDFILNILK